MPQSVFDALSNDTVAMAETLSVMMHQEQTTYRCKDYIHSSGVHHHSKATAPFSSRPLTAADRIKVVDWYYGVVDHCEFDRETVSIAMEMVDRFLSVASSSKSSNECVLAQDILCGDRGTYQLVAMSALYIAIKTKEQVAFGSDAFAVLSRGMYTAQEIEAMEMTILRTLSWRVNAPTSVQVANHILSLILPRCGHIRESTWEVILDEVRYQTEIAVRDYYFVTQRPSTVAMAAIINALDSVSCHDRQVVLKAMLGIFDQDFDSPQEMDATSKRMMMSLAQGDISGDEDSTVMSEGDDELIPSSPSRSPKTVACSCGCRRENALCESCIRLEIDRVAI